MIADLSVLVLFLGTVLGKNIDTSGFVGLNFNVARGNSFQTSNSTNLPKFVKRSDPEGTTTIELDNQNTFYSVLLQIGSEKDQVLVTIDTGSSDLWVSSSKDKFCQKATEDNPYACYGTFDESSSTSYVSNDTAFFASYGDGTYAFGTWGYDNFLIDDLTVDNLSFAVANQSNSSTGVLGIGFEELETTVTGDLVGVEYEAYTYANLPSKLVQDGLIHKRVYSLWLNDVSEYSGKILFGALDHAKYEGDLIVLPIDNPYASEGYPPMAFLVTVSGISLNSDSDTVDVSSDSISVLLDSGTSLTYLPSSVVSSIASALGASYSDYYGYYMMNCPTSNDVNVTYNFQGTNINVPLVDVVLAADDTGDVCVLALMPSDDTIIFGDSFLRSAYVVYDLDNYQIGIAQAKYTNDTDIEVISGDIPGSTTIQPSTTESYSLSSGSPRRTTEENPGVTALGNDTIVPTDTDFSTGFTGLSGSGSTTSLGGSKTGGSSKTAGSGSTSGSPTAATTSETASSSRAATSAKNAGFAISVSSWTSISVLSFFLLYI